jgi:hypothetical protein
MFQMSFLVPCPMLNALVGTQQKIILATFVFGSKITFSSPLKFH